MAVGLGVIGGGGYSGEQKLTAATKAKLERLGIDTSNVKTEAEGRMLLKIAVQERINKAKATAEINGDSKTGAELPDWILQIASELNIDCSVEKNPQTIINKVVSIIEEKIAKTDNLAEKTEYNEKLKKIKQLSNAKNSLSAAMEMTAYMNITYFGFKVFSS